MQRKMKIEPSCPVRGRYDEDGGHIFFKCKTIKQVWCLLNMEEEQVRMVGMSSTKEIMEFILSTRNEKKMHLLMTLWIMRRGERNAIRTGGK